MKKVTFISVLFVLLASFASASVINKTQLIKSDHWVYDAMTVLASETRVPLLTETAPLTAGELLFNLSLVDRESLSESGKALFDEVEEFLSTQDRGFHSKVFHFSGNIVFQPEAYYKSNKDIEWSYDNTYKGDFAYAPLKAGFSDYFTGEMDPGLAQNYTAAHKWWNTTNFPVQGVAALEFRTPLWCYGSAGITFDGWGIGAYIAREGLRIGNGLFGSIIYNSTFDTDVVAQFNVYNPTFKYNLDVIQISPNRNNSKRMIYLHQFTANICKKVKLSLIEGTLSTTTFELQNLNPFGFMHDFGLWELERDENGRKDTKTAQYFGFIVEFFPFKNHRFYFNYAQNEITLAFESSDANPSSMGLQTGWDFTIPSTKRGFWHGQMEAMWTFPYLYQKKRGTFNDGTDKLNNSFYSHRWDIHQEEYVDKWMGTPYGPDVLGFAAEFGYEMQKKWSLKAGWKIFAKGDKSAFRDKLTNPDAYTSLYPSTVFEEARDAGNQADMDAAMDESKRLLPGGTVQLTNILSVKGNYYVNRFCQLYGQISYTFVNNSNHESNNFKHGVEILTSCKIELW